MVIDWRGKGGRGECTRALEPFFCFDGIEGKSIYIYIIPIYTTSLSWVYFYSSFLFSWHTFVPSALFLLFHSSFFSSSNPILFYVISLFLIPHFFFFLSFLKFSFESWKQGEEDQPNKFLVSAVYFAFHKFQKFSVRFMRWGKYGVQKLVVRRKNFSNKKPRYLINRFSDFKRDFAKINNIWIN